MKVRKDFIITEEARISALITILRVDLRLKLYLVHCLGRDKLLGVDCVEVPLETGNITSYIAQICLQP